MIRFLQKKGAVQKALWAIIIGIVCVSMVAFLGSYFTGQDSRTNATGVYATVGDQTVNSEDIRQQARQAAQQQLQGQALPDYILRMFQQQQTQQAAQRLVMRAAVLEQAGKMGLRVTDQEVADFLHQGELGRALFPNGKFVGPDEADRIILGLTQGQAGRVKFEQDVRESLLFNKLIAVVQGAVTVPAAEIETEYKKQNVKVKFDYAVVSAEDLAKKVSVTEPELRAYYEQNKAQLKDTLPEQRKIKYVVIDASKLPVQISDDDYKQAYNQAQSQFKTPEQVDVRHILVKTKEQALDIKKQLEGGADFAALAKKYSDDPGSKDTGGLYKNVEHGKMVPEFDKAAFELQPGKISDPVQTSFGFHILKVDAHRPAGQKSLAEVKPELEEMIRTRKQRDAADTLANQVLSDAKSGGLDKAAASRQLKVTTTDYVAADASLPGIGSSPEVMSQIFTFQKDTPSVARAGQNEVVADVLDIKPKSTPTFEQARKQLEDSYRQDRAQQMVGQKSQELAEKAKAAGDLKKAAKELGLAVKTSDFVAPTGQVPDLGAMSNAEVAFDMKKGDVSPAINTGRGGAVLQIVDRQEPTAAEFDKQRDQIRERLAGQKRMQALNDFAVNVRDRMMRDGTIRINKQEETRLFGGNTPPGM
jgi:peptidyl-prolyl cis-trans isomerase D